MTVLRTPESRFIALKDYPFEPHYVELDGIRMHYVDVGPRAAYPILMMHGEPSWSYLYRHMIPRCVAAGHRVIAPDLIGFGRSDKFTDMADYSYQHHMDWMRVFLEKLDLKHITLVCQDWGSLLGLRLAAENEARFDRIVVANGMLPTGDLPVPLAFHAWKAFARFSPWFPISRIVDMGSLRKLSPEELHAYDAPFPSSKFLAGARAFPRLVPITPEDPATKANRAAWSVLERWEKPFLTAFSDGDPITRGGDKYLQSRIPGAKGQRHVTLHGGHFLQEDSPHELADVINRFIADTARQLPGKQSH